MATEAEWLQTKAAFQPGFISDTGGFKFLIVSHFDYEEEFWLGNSRCVGMKARNLDNGQEFSWPAKDWISLWRNMADTQAKQAQMEAARNGKTNSSHAEGDPDPTVRGSLPA